MQRRKLVHSSLLSDEEWKRIQRQLPIACVDLMPIRFSQSQPRRVEAIGLIQRSTPHQGERWCLVGGRLRYSESLGEGLTRQVHETLGPDAQISPTPAATLQPLYVAQYLPHGASGENPDEYQRGDGWDPRKHAIGLTYALELVGQPN